MTQTILRNIGCEFKINWLFIKRDITVSIIPGILFTLTALLNYPPTSLANWISFLGRNIIYFWLCITYFCMSNQLTSIEEDRLNKPDRPLIQGIVSYRGTQIRWYVLIVILSLVAWYLGIFEWALLWQLSSIVYNYFGGAKHWIYKNILNGFGIFAEMGASWQMVAPISPIVWSWIVVLGIAFTSLISIADFRDISGDKAIGRSTFPIVFGEEWGRLILSLKFLIFPLFIHLFLMTPLGNNLNIFLWNISIFIISCIVAVRVFIFRSCEADHKTYIIFTYWYCLVLTSSIFVLRL
ncbi:hypothetical protein AMR41_02805 [Hapalosiphon sp. MRB220]|nr:hypothetical protein AMR41_02805 [Hapalosiphon sp. MRB220]